MREEVGGLIMLRRRKIKWLPIALAVIFLIGVVAGNLLWKIESLLRNISVNEGAQTAYHTDRPLSLLILGSDKRGEYGGDLTDVMLLAVFNPKTKKVSILSIPRDTRVIIPGENVDRKINSVMKHGEELKAAAIRKGEKPQTDGISLLKKTIESIYGIPIQQYVSINFDGFRKTIDQLGGIEVNVDKRLVYHDPTDGTAIDLNPGLQKLNGDQALGFVRHRHDDRGLSYFSTDYERNARQQVVIRAGLNKLKTLSGMTNFFNILDVIGQNLKTDLSVDQMKGLYTDFSKMDGANLVSINQNGADWDSASSRTIIPLKTLEETRTALLVAMEMDKGIGKYNNSPAGEGNALPHPSKGTLDNNQYNSEDDSVPSASVNDSSSQGTNTSTNPVPTTNSPATKNEEQGQTKEDKPKPSTISPPPPPQGQGSTNQGSSKGGSNSQAGGLLPVLGR